MQSIFKIETEGQFEKAALGLFREQYNNIPVYHSFCDYLGKNPGNINSLWEIPFMPVEFFKSHKILHTGRTAKMVFESSATGGKPSRHYIAEPELYRESFKRTFELFYGPAQDYAILALLPSYLERQNSSLLFMMNDLMKTSGKKESGFYLYNYRELMETLLRLKKENRKIILIGVSFALLDLAEKFKEDLSGSIIMETGGMKGRRKEVTREELHFKIMKSFNVDQVHSEYGMTELLSQAYSKENGRFYAPPWLKIMVKDLYDPLEWLEKGKTGTLSIIDLANRYSCSFLSTSDLGKINDDGSFEVLGRSDQSEIRGCNLMVL